uniref:Uncharacterized protein n=1 Tax=Arundo donax TaxID=35708 RepID=A0A0A9FVQ4_ARUDO
MSCHYVNKKFILLTICTPAEQTSSIVSTRVWWLILGMDVWAIDHPLPTALH